MIWPFKKKMTVDYLASVVAEAIGEDISVYHEAIRNHAGENVTDQDIDNLNLELWALELSILDLVLPMTKVPSEMAQQLVPILVVGYSPLDKNTHIDRAKYYAVAVSKGPAEQFTVNLAKAFGGASRIEFKSERQNVNRQALEWAIGTVATGSFQGLRSLIGNISSNYRIY